MVCPDCNAVQVGTYNNKYMRSLNRLKDIPETKAESSNSIFLSSLLMVAGGFGLIYFFFIFDTSIAVPTSTLMGQTIGGVRVNNLGFMNDRQNGMIFCGVITIIGAIFHALNGKK